MNLIKRQSPARLIALGFISLILIGSILLRLPFCVKEGVHLSYIDSLYTSTSAVCVTGLIAVDAGDTFTPLGQMILGLLMQTGGLGVTTVGAGLMLLMRKKVDLKERTLVKEALNVDSGKGLITLVKRIFIVTIVFETAGALLSLLVFIQDYPFPKALGISIFHSVAAFNNAGFDILGNFQSLVNYSDSIMLNIVTCFLIFFGGIGFLVIWELLEKKCRWKKLSMHAKIVLSVSGVLIVVGTVLIKATENVSWMGAVFNSISARTAGFSTYSLAGFSKSGLLVIMILMFIGSSPGSTGGGIKTTTFFVLLQGIRSSATNTSEKAFHYSIPKDAYKKASVIALIAASVIILGTYLMGIFEPDADFFDVFFEVTSAYGTVGLSTGITPGLSVPSKLLSIIIMYIGRLGPWTVATLWHFSKGERVSFPEGNISIG
ncbi:MAG: potassium transporter TrkG [Lachnospira sp.]|nr:potassium transporter TrkG [Lachnospira sp.]